MRALGFRSTLDVRGGIAATDINITGIATIANLQVAAGDVDLTNLKVTGFSTLGGLTVDQLTVTGFTTFTDLSYDEITGRNLNLTGIATIPQLDGLTTFTDAISERDVNVGVATITTANVTTANVTTLAGYPNFSGGATVSGVVTAAQFIGAGQIGIGTSGGLVGYGVSFLDFRGLVLQPLSSILLLVLQLLFSKVEVEAVVQVLVLVLHLVMLSLVLLLLETCGIIQDLEDSSSIIKMIIAHSG